MHLLRAARDLEAPRVLLGVPAFEFPLPRRPRFAEPRDAFVAVRGAGELAPREACDQRERRSRASPQIVTAGFLTRPSTRGSASTWISFALFGQ